MNKLIIPIIIILILVAGIGIYFVLQKPPFPEPISRCGNGICEKGESVQCPRCVYDPINPCKVRCTEGTCPRDCNTPMNATKTCSELSGDICSSSQTCSGELLDASDTEKCCGGECQIITINKTNFMTGIIATYGGVGAPQYVSSPLQYKGTKIDISNYINYFDFWPQIGFNIFSSSIANSGDFDPAGVWPIEFYQRMQKNDAEILVNFFYSTYSDLVQQPSAPRWSGYTLEQRAQAFHKYSRDAAKFFKDGGVNVKMYEIGNEINFGISGIFAPEGRESRSINSLKANIWPDMAYLIKSAIAGVKEVDSNAKFSLHLALPDTDDFANEFFTFMLEQGVQLDYLALSYYPVGQKDETWILFQKVINNLSTLQIPIVIREYSYPSSNPGYGTPMSGYPFTPPGQYDQLKNFLEWAYQNPNIVGVIYTRVDEYQTDWQPMSLFDSQGKAKPALDAFKEFKR